ncbi:GFA family protein [Rhizobium sp. IBUN]|uniref:GFA family protein n=1 Tax=Rhizobium sp. IBUN TaxID=1042326 RepID=UPI0003FDE011|nr:GFA family protein [Rhizobium sp. IBUN]
MSDQKSYSGRCFCGAVEIVATGEPVAMGYCHCASCRHWSAGPVNAFTLWQPQAVRVTKGGEHVEGYQKSDTSVRKFCELCGGHLYTEHPTWGVTDVYAALLPDLDYTPALHVNYQESVLRIRDGLPKYRDMPAEMGGSGDTLPE